jgi:hypothetical protein
MIGYGAYFSEWFYKFPHISSPEKDRARVVPSPHIVHENQETSGRYHWAALLKRVFQSDLLRCPRCGSEVRTLTALFLLLFRCPN